MPDWLLLTACTVATCGLVLLIVLLRRRRTPADTAQTPDVIEYITMMIGVVYAIVLGLAMAGVWEERHAAEDWVRAEALALHEISTRAEAYPEEIRQDIRDQVDSYVSFVLDEEWEEMLAEQELSERGDELLAELRRTVTVHEPVTPLEAYGYHGLMDRASAADEARMERGEASEPTMPRLVWIGLISGGVVAVGMIFALQIQGSPREIVLATLFTALIAFLLFLIWYFDEPLARSLPHATEPFETLFPHLADGGD